MNVLASHIHLTHRKDAYRTAPVYRNIVINQFLKPTIAPEAYDNFPVINSNKGINYTQEDSVSVQLTEYRAQLHDGAGKKMMVWGDKMLLKGHEKLKRVAEVGHKFTSKWRRWFSKN